MGETQRLGAKSRNVRSQMRKLGPMLQGSVILQRMKCGKPNCRCKRGYPHTYLCVTYNEKGKTKTVYVNKSLHAEAFLLRILRIPTIFITVIMNCLDLYRLAVLFNTKHLSPHNMSSVFSTKCIFQACSICDDGSMATVLQIAQDRRNFRSHTTGREVPFFHVLLGLSAG